MKIIMVLFITSLCFGQNYYSGYRGGELDSALKRTEASVTGWVYVSDYYNATVNGMIPNEADITEALQEAANTHYNVRINATGGEVNDKKYYISSPITISTSSQIIEGMGHGYGVNNIAIAANGKCDTLLYITGYNVIIRDLSFDGQDTCLYGIYNKSAGFGRIEDCYFTNFRKVTDDDTSYAVYFYNSITNTISNCVITRNEAGLFAYFAHGVSILGTTINYNDSINVSMKKSYAVSMHGGTVEGTDVIGHGNWYFDDCRISLFGIYQEQAGDWYDMYIAGAEGSKTTVNVYGGAASGYRIMADSSDGEVQINFFGGEIYTKVSPGEDLPPIHFVYSGKEGGQLYSYVNLYNVEYVGNAHAVINCVRYTSNMNKEGLTWFDFFKKYQYVDNSDESLIRDLNADTLSVSVITTASMPTDSSALTTGRLYFDATTGAIKRKF